MARRVKVELIGDARSLNRAFESAGLHAQRFGDQTSRTRRLTRAAFAGIGIGAVAGIGLAAKVLKDSVSAAMEAERVQAQTQAALKSTGGVAKVTAGHIANLADRISQYSGIDDEAVQASENLLLTFTRIRNEVGKGNNIFDQATVAVQDMSVALKQDAKSSAIQLGKALGDPVRGMTALRRVGVTFTNSQADLIKKLVSSGHLLQAQKMILREVQKEFGGSARAAGQTFGGQLSLLRVNVENLQERIGKLLLPVLNRWVRNINHWLSQAKNQRKLIHDIRVTVTVLARAFRILAAAIRVVVAVSRALIPVFRWLEKHKGPNLIEMWAAAKKATMDFYNWIRIQGLKIGLALVEPFTHLGPLGGWAKRAKKSFQAQIAEIQGGKGPAAARNASGRIIPPGGRTAVGVLTAGLQPTTIHTHVHLDGKQVAKTVTKHQQRGGQLKSTQRTGRHAGGGGR